ncbi:beta 1-4 rhamnosyltransferase Cps2T [Aquibacillus rhizosphaerae]|uniref:DUF1972 domain-containing protein n=1 Tax=Aquibacillus rhizosphaerae TaxID=3051431 RepID=A0ABT7L2X0_9BACI|nr:DUF1972 domain-containing protein [Aquibacillus sp. LR5S19]MDL4838956.1 DUF1972 domain-containing protein [Aquibacillus sp. LR5S19]
MTNVFIIGSKGIPAKYGGFETFVENLTSRNENPDIRYHIACLSEDSDEEYIYNNSRCFNVKVPNIGSAKAVLYDLISLKKSIEYIKKNNIQDSIIYVLTCRIGPFLVLFKKQIEKYKIKLCVNPDGNEWKRSKWNKGVKKYWKYSEKLSIKNIRNVICDSKGIEKYINEEYSSYSPITYFIPYGAELTSSRLTDKSQELKRFYNEHKVKKNEFYLVVGRFVPENNIQTIIKEFINSDTSKDLIIISNVEKNKFYNQLLDETKFDLDKKVKFVGTIYDQELLKKIREDAFAYIHGHEVGGTNPSLLEALASTKINLLYNVNFNREVGGDSALYFSKDDYDLKNLIGKVEDFECNDIRKYAGKAKERIREEYNWSDVVNSYEQLFLSI